MKPFKTVSVAEAVQMLAEADPLILDCRDLKDYRAGHIENAMHVHEKLRDSLLTKGDKNRLMLIYCYYGHATARVVTAIRKKCLRISTIARPANIWPKCSATSASSMSTAWPGASPAGRNTTILRGDV
jgi:rhodanese-related sulfurtransferase